MFKTADRMESTPVQQPTRLPVIDWDDVMNRIGGDMDFLKELAGIFLEDYPMLITNIRQAATESDTVKLSKATHTLKGAIGNFGAPLAHAAAVSLETAADEGALGNIDNALSGLESEVEKVIEVLKEL